MIVLLSGPIAAGKTTIAERVVGLARRRGIACRGLLAPALLDGCGRKTGIVGLDLATGERRTLARTDRELDGPRLGPYSFDASALEWAAGVVVEALAYPDLVIIDEIGRLELEQGVGLAGALPMLASGGAGRVLVLVRDWLAEALRARLGQVEMVVMAASEENREALPGAILEALLEGGRDPSLRSG